MTSICWCNIKNFKLWSKGSFELFSYSNLLFSKIYRIWLCILASKIYFWAMKKYFRASINSNRLVCHCHGFIYRNMLYILFRRINWIRLSQLLYRYSTTSFVTDYKFWPILTTFDLKIMTSCSDTYYNSKVKWESNLSFD